MVSPAGRKAKISKVHRAPLEMVSRREIPKEVVVEGACRACTNCGIQSTSRRRVFSEQAWTLLLLWNEITPAAVEQPMCDVCYDDLRETLIDRNEEVEKLMHRTNRVSSRVLENAV
jgi:hypothetical protein